MKEGVDPDMDGLKKLVSGRLRTQAVEPHPDPDVLSAFAENALRESERAQVLQHLGACNDCRDILYLAAEHSPEAQPVLSFQPRRSSWLTFRWGALAASVVIVAGAVIANYRLHHDARAPRALTAPATESYSKVADKKVPADVREMRDKLAQVPQTVIPTIQTPAKDRPETKHMTAKPQATMQFDDTDQVRVGAPLNIENSKKLDQGLPTVGRNVMSLAPLVKDRRQTGADLASAASAGQSAQQQALQNSLGGVVGGTVVDPSGAVVGNVKVTMVGPIGSKTATSDGQGNFMFNSLAPGSYSIKAEASGFKSSEITNVAVLDNKRATVGVTLEPGSTAETVEVSAEALTAPEGVNGYTATEEMALQKAMASNSPQRASALTPQWTISAKGALERSLDLGKTWHKVSVAHGVIFRALSVLGPQIWVGGNRGSLYHSADSGQTWTKIVPSTADATLTLDINHVEFSDGNAGTVSTTNGETWSTSDGGQTWRRK